MHYTKSRRRKKERQFLNKNAVMHRACWKVRPIHIEWRKWAVNRVRSSQCQDGRPGVQRQYMGCHEPDLETRSWSAFDVSVVSDRLEWKTTHIEYQV